MEWISVKDKLPDASDYVLCARLQTSMDGRKYLTPSVGKLRTGGIGFTCEMDWVNVTHWMPLPEPPKE